MAFICLFPRPLSIISRKFLLPPSPVTANFQPHFHFSVLQRFDSDCLNIERRISNSSSFFSSQFSIGSYPVSSYSLFKNKTSKLTQVEKPTSRFFQKPQMAYSTHSPSPSPSPLSHNSNPHFSPSPLSGNSRPFSLLTNILPYPSLSPSSPVSGCFSKSSLGSEIEGSLKKRGAFILLEGLDRSGKSTQCEKLVEYLKGEGRKAILLRFPDRNTTTGQKISSYLKNTVEIDDKTIHLLFTENRQEKMEEMEKLLEEGVTLVVDRYSISGVAFSAAKGLDLDWCKTVEQKLPAPDVVFYLDLPVEVAATRGGYGEERYEKVEFQRAVASQFEKLKDNTWKVINAKQSIWEVQDELRRASHAVVEHCATKGPSIRRMWPQTE